VAVRIRALVTLNARVKVKSLKNPRPVGKETERRRSPAAKQIRKRRVAVSKAWELPGG
jgi:hypothetical protein